VILACRGRREANVQTSNQVSSEWPGTSGTRALTIGESAGSGYLTTSEAFPLEVRAEAIAVRGHKGKLVKVAAIRDATADLLFAADRRETQVHRDGDPEQ
jgi:hypothetical protein